MALITNNPKLLALIEKGTIKSFPPRKEQLAELARLGAKVPTNAQGGPATRKDLAAAIAAAKTKTPTGTSRPASTPLRKAPASTSTPTPPVGNLAAMRASYDSSKKEGQAERLQWWDMNGDAYLAAIQASRAPKSERIKDQFAAMPAGPERSAFYKQHRDTLTR